MIVVSVRNIQVLCSITTQRKSGRGLTCKEFKEWKRVQGRVEGHELSQAYNTWEVMWQWGEESCEDRGV